MCRLKSPAPGTRPSMLALVAYRSYRGAATVWAFVVAVLIVLVAGWYVRRRRQVRHPRACFSGTDRPLWTVDRDLAERTATPPAVGAEGQVLLSEYRGCRLPSGL